MQGQPAWAIVLAISLLTVVGLAIGLGAVLTILWISDQLTKRPPPKYPFDTL